MSELADLLTEIRALCAEAQDWGRHHRRHIAFLERASASLLPRLEAEGALGGLSARWEGNRPPQAPCLPHLPEEPEERFLERAQAFHALQLLRLHHDALSRLRDSSRSGPPSPTSLRDVLAGVESRYEWISRTTMEAMLGRFLLGGEVPPYALLNVGTSLHLDDIDVGAIAAEDSERLNRGLSRLAGEMIRRASRLHFYLAEHLGTDTYYATVARYRHWIDQGVRNYVAVSELLNARFICGSRPLFEKFVEQVGGRFYYALGREAEHYAYVRGILTEVRALFRQEEGSFSIDFKRDAIRAIRALVSVESTRYNVREASVWAALGALRAAGERLRDIYQGLEEVLAFFEFFRYLYQLFVVQEEHVTLSDEQVLATLDPIGRLMGYEEIRQIRPGNRLLLEYNAALIRSRRLVQTLLEQERVYVRTLYVFGKIARGGRFLPSLADIRGNLGREFLEVVRSFRGTAFWQDILHLLTNIDRDSLRRFADDLLDLPDSRALVERYVRLVSDETQSLLRLLLVIGEHRDYDRISRLFWMFVEAWLDRLRRKVSERERFLAVCREQPLQFVRLLQSLDQAHQEALRQTLSRPVRRRELIRVRRRLLHILSTFTRCSRFFERTLRHVVQHHPQVLEHLEDGLMLARMARTILLEALQAPDPAWGIAEARVYYEIEFVRLGMEIMAGRRIPVLLREFRRMSERTVDALATLCRRQIAPESEEPPFAILATGGNAREEGYLADYDAIFVARDEPSALDLCHRVAVRFNAELTRLGVLPHHLFAEHFGRYAVTIPELLEFLQRDRGSDFVERSEILGSRFVHGSAALHRQFVEQVVTGEVLRHRRAYLRAMLDDDEERRKAASQAGGPLIRLKSDPGGLKDIHLTLDLLRARFGIAEAIPRRLFPKLVALDPQHQEEYFTLLRTLNFLLRLRVLYQLTVGHDSTIDPAQMQHALGALRLGPGRGDLEAALLERYRVRTARAAQATARLSAWLRSELGGRDEAGDVESPPPSAILGLGTPPVGE